MTRSAGLYLMIEATPGAPALDRTKAALAAAPMASLLIAAPEGAKLDAGLARPFVELAQAHEVAALIDADAALARVLRADGVHVRPGDGFEARLAEAREILGGRQIIGAEAATRHEAMVAGEAGADYVAFGPDVMDELAPWWAEIFEPPCVALGVADTGHAADMAAAGVDFIGFAIDNAATPADAADRVRAVEAAVAAAAAGIEDGPGTAGKA